jgi:hypothetical protein
MYIDGASSQRYTAYIAWGLKPES